MLMREIFMPGDLYRIFTSEIQPIMGQYYKNVSTLLAIMETEYYEGTNWKSASTTTAVI